MKNFINILLICLCAVLLTASSCQIIGGIFKAGVYVGVFAVLVILFLVVWLIAKIRKR